MSDNAHQHWGRVKDNYDSKYVYDAKVARQKLDLSQQVMDRLHTDGGNTITKLRALGESTYQPDWSNSRNRITLSMLQSLVEYAAFACCLPKLGNPMVLCGCIKLMKSITRFGRRSPFSYEYGHLCFRIFLLAFDCCILQLSDRLKQWSTEMTQPHNQILKEGLAPMLSNTISEIIDECMVKGGEAYYHKIIAPRLWSENYTGPIIAPEDIRVLTQILDDDKHHFLLFLRLNYSLRLSGLLYAMLQLMHRTPPTPGNRPFIEAFLRVYNTSLLLAPGYPLHRGRQHEYVMQVLQSYDPTGVRYSAGYSSLMLHAYVERLLVLSKTSQLHPRINSAQAVELLQYILPLVGDGCEVFVPPAIRATIRCMREDLGECRGNAPHEVTEACIRLFEYIRRFFELITGRHQVTGNQNIIAATDAMFGEGFLAIFARMLGATCSEDDSNFSCNGECEAKPIWERMDSIFHLLRGTAHWQYIHERLVLAAMQLTLHIGIPKFVSALSLATRYGEPLK